MSRLSFLLWQAITLLAMSSLPGVSAFCFIDDNGFERCSLSNGARVGVAIAIIVLALLFIAGALMYRRRRTQRNNVSYLGQNNAQALNYTNQQGGYAPAYNAPYYPSPAPQYPPPVHGWDPQNTYAPPQGPPPGYYPPPAGSPPPGKEPYNL